MPVLGQRIWTTAAASATPTAPVYPPPTDPTADISTAGASGSYSEATVTTVTSSLDPVITDLKYARCHDTGHAGADKLVPTLLFPGFHRSAVTDFDQTFRRRFASYVDPTSGRAPCVYAIDSRGRGAISGQLDYVRDRQDRLDCIEHATAAVGASNFFADGNRVIVIGYSTGALDAALFALTFPDLVAGIVFYWPNFDLGVDPDDSYWALKPNMRSAYMTPSVGDRGTGSALALDPFLARNAIDGIARLVAMEGGPHLWLFGDEDEAPSVPIPRPSRLAAALQAIPAAIPKSHIYITKTASARRYLHGDGTAGDWGIGGDSNTWAERLFMPTLLAGMSEWSFPRQTTLGGYRVLGWMQTREITGSTDPSDDRPGFEVWLGTTSDPKGYLDATPRLSGGCQHAAEMLWNDAGGQFEFYPVTSQPGYVQVIRGAESRSVRFGDNQSECTADFTGQQSESGIQSIPETNTSLFADLVASNQLPIPDLWVPCFVVPAGYEGGDAQCTYTDRYGDTKSRLVYLAGKGGTTVYASFVCQELSVQLTSAGSNAGRAVSVQRRSAIATPDAPVHDILVVWDDVGTPAPLTLTEENLTEGFAAIDETALSSTYRMLFSYGPISQDTRVLVNLNESPVLTTQDDLVLMGATHAWHSDSGGLIVGSPVSSWTDEIAGLALTSTSGKQPDPGTDGDGIQYIGFTAGNEDRLGVAFPGDPNQDFTFAMVCTCANNTSATLLDWAHVLHNNGGNIRVIKGDSGGNVGVAISATRDGPPSGGIDTLAGGIGNTITASSTTKRFVVFQRQGDTMTIASQDASDASGGLSWKETTISGTFATSDLRLTIGGWWANTIDDYYNWATTRMYAVLFFPKALSRAEVEGLRAYEKTRMVF